MVVGRLPYQSEDLAGLMYEKISIDPPPPSHFINISKNFDEIVLKAISRSKEDRFEDADEFRYSLLTLIEI